MWHLSHCHLDMHFYFQLPQLGCKWRWEHPLGEGAQLFFPLLAPPSLTASFHGKAAKPSTCLVVPGTGHDRLQHQKNLNQGGSHTSQLTQLFPSSDLSFHLRNRFSLSAFPGVRWSRPQHLIRILANKMSEGLASSSVWGVLAGCLQG